MLHLQKQIKKAEPQETTMTNCNVDGWGGSLKKSHKQLYNKRSMRSRLQSEHDIPVERQFRESPMLGKGQHA